MRQLPPQDTRPEDEPEYEKETWQPSWQCFCCHDSGRVVPHLARLVIPDYNYTRHKLPRCQNPGCTFGNYWDSEGLADSVDYRFTSDLCQELDLLEREDWKQFTPVTPRRVIERIREVAKQKSRRRRDGQSPTFGDRNSTEDMIAKQRHQQALSGWGIEAQNEQEQKFIAGWKKRYEKM
ncbi:MAG: hypothetical protein SAL70_42720 [Scytonema sp. PMC 1070.18]|nr:hypothetical protein [Scytonema sp. PMC 1070.18]